jgi:pimeloyl-ACP methyl ester carboxylesterase
LKDLRKYGDPPFNVAVIHGGPGAPGEMMLVAKELSYKNGVLEPLQTGLSIEEQSKELMSALKKQGELPVVLVGYSWGAWLSYIFAATYPSFISKIILVGSGPFKEKYASKIMETRLNRLNKKERKEAISLIESLNENNTESNEKNLARFGELMFKADSYNPLFSNDKLENVEVHQEVYRKVWAEASELRKSGELLELGNQIECPVIAIHGEYDPHPYRGVKEPLSQVIKDFKFILLASCGHTPWLEREAKDKFYRLIEEELN